MTPRQRRPQALIPPVMTCPVAKNPKSESTNVDAPLTVVKNTSKGFRHVMRRSTTLFLLTPQHPSLMRNKPSLNCWMERTEPKTEHSLMKKAEKVGLKTTPSPGALRLRTGRSRVKMSASAD